MAAERPAPGGRLIDRFGLRWQVVPAMLDEMMGDEDTARSKRVAEAMLKMVKLDIAALERAYRSESPMEGQTTSAEL